MNREDRPWGFFETLLDEPDYKVKRITINLGCRLSLQQHQKRDEYWVVVGGNGVIYLGDNPKSIEWYALPNGERVSIPRGSWHRVENLKESVDPLVMIEIQVGECREDDIVRAEDDYGRA